MKLPYIFNNYFQDFSCDDRKFAANLGLTFYTEAEFFLGAAKEEFSWMGVEPKKVTATPSAVQAFKQRFGSYARTTQGVNSGYRC